MTKAKISQSLVQRTVKPNDRAERSSKAFTFAFVAHKAHLVGRRCDKFVDSARYIKNQETLSSFYYWIFMWKGRRETKRVGCSVNFNEISCQYCAEELLPLSFFPSLDYLAFKLFSPADTHNLFGPFFPSFLIHWHISARRAYQFASSRTRQIQIASLPCCQVGNFPPCLSLSCGRWGTNFSSLSLSSFFSGAPNAVQPSRPLIYVLVRGWEREEKQFLHIFRRRLL